MIGAWMLYASAIGVLLAVAAGTLERAMRARRWPLRWIWVGALVAMIVLPAAALVMTRAAARTDLERALASMPDASPSTLASLAQVRAFGGPVVIPARSRLAALDRPLAAMWGLASCAVVLALAGSALATRRRRRSWRATSADGFRVLISPDIGPAVVGWWAPTIVLPEWVLDLPLARRRLILTHELEHVDAGDARLLLVAAAAVAVLPWNVALWYGVRRLRLAAEIDCDARVLRSGADVRSYGTLLLDIGERVSKHPAAMVAAFSEPTSFLERRLRIMSMRTPRRLALHTAAFASLAALALVLACETPRPLAPHPTDGLVAVGANRARPTARVQASARPARNPALLAAMRQYYPDILRGESRDSAVWFIAKEGGAIFATDRGMFNEAAVRAKDPRFTVDQITSVEIEKNRDGVFGPNPVGAILITITADGSPAPHLAKPAAGPGSTASTSEMQVQVLAPGPEADGRRAATNDALRTIVRQRHPAALQAPAGSEMFLTVITNASGDVVSSTAAATSRERSSAMRDIAPDRIASVNVGKVPAGDIGAARIDYLWIKLKS